jgi:hypothetical protein
VAQGSASLGLKWLPADLRGGFGVCWLKAALRELLQDLVGRGVAGDGGEP